MERGVLQQHDGFGVDDATIGDPFLGTKEKGEQIFERAAKNLTDFIEEVKKMKVEIKSRDYDTRAW